MSDLRVLEVEYGTAPETGAVPIFDGAVWNPISFTTLFYSLLPIGIYVPYGGGTAPDGWLFCDGSQVSRTTYALLFAVLSTTYGIGDGSTTFHLPDIRQKVPMGLAASGTGSTRGASGGSVDHTHTVPAHYHEKGAGADLAVKFFDGSASYGLGGATATGVAPVAKNTSADITGKIGLVTGGVDGNDEMTSGANNQAFLAQPFIIWTGLSATVPVVSGGELMGALGLTYP